MENHLIILGQPWIKKLRVIIDITNNFLAFWPSHRTHIRATSLNILCQFRLPAKTAVIRIEKDITPQKIIKRGSKKDMNDFLEMSNKLFSKKKRQINKSKRKISIEEINSKKATISSLDSSDKKKLLVPMPATKKSDLKAKNINIAMIGPDSYCAACCLKKAQLFDILIRDIQYQAKKKTRAETDPISIVPQEYHNYLNIFSKKNSDSLPLYQKYDHKMYLEEKQKLSHAPLYKMSSKKLDVVKQYLDSYLAKKFLQASLASYSLPILFVKKPEKKIRFCVDYKKLNTITKKDCYLILLIEEKLA